MTDKKSIVGKMLSKRQLNTMNNNIATLESVEKSFFTKQAENLDAMNKENMQQKTLFRAQMKAQAAIKVCPYKIPTAFFCLIQKFMFPLVHIIKAEEKARKALLEAEKHTISCNQFLKESETSLSQIQTHLNKSMDEVNKVSNVLGRQQEKIRKCLLKKRMFVQESNNNKDDDVKMVDNSEASSTEEESLRMLEELKKEERSLALEKRRIEDRLLRMQSRKEKLKLKINTSNLRLDEVASSWD